MLDSRSGEIPLVAGLVGSAAASEWATWRDTMDLPDPEDLLSGKVDIKSVTRGDQLHVALGALVSASLIDHPDMVGRQERAWTILSKQRSDVALSPAASLLTATEEVPKVAVELAAKIRRAQA